MNTKPTDLSEENFSINYKDDDKRFPSFCFFCGKPAKIIKTFQKVKTIDINPLGQLIKVNSGTPTSIPSCNEHNCALKARRLKLVLFS